MAARKTVRTDIKELVFSRIENILAKPRTSAHSPISLVEVVYGCLYLVYEDRRYERYMNDEYPSSKAWYFEEGLDFQIVVNRLQKLMSKLHDED
jgi:hypothetical protein